MLDWGRGRPTADLIVLFLTGIVGVMLLLTVAAALWIELTDDTKSTSDLLHFDGEVIKSFTAIIIGYLAGRGVSERNGKNGGH
jgi:hypothetical protein